MSDTPTVSISNATFNRIVAFADKHDVSMASVIETAVFGDPLRPRRRGARPVTTMRNDAREMYERATGRKL